jgi:hypothetical protein
MEWMTVQEVRFSGTAYCGPCLAPLMEALLLAEDSNPAIIEPDITADGNQRHRGRRLWMGDGGIRQIWRTNAQFLIGIVNRWAANDPFDPRRRHMRYELVIP